MFTFIALIAVFTLGLVIGLLVATYLWILHGEMIREKVVSKLET